MDKHKRYLWGKSKGVAGEAGTKFEENLRWRDLWQGDNFYGKLYKIQDFRGCGV